MITETEESQAQAKGLAIYQRVANITKYQAEVVAVMHKTVAKNTSIAELTYFLTVCKSLGLNPINKEVWCYKDNLNNLLVFTGRDGFLSKAQANDKWGGMRSCEVCENDIWEADLLNDEIKHVLAKGDRGAVIGAWCKVFVKGCEPTIEYVNFKRYDKGRNTWKLFPEDMIKKVAECHALKKAFGMSNLTCEYDFVIKDNIAQPVGFEDIPHETVDKEEERILKLIAAATDRPALEKIKDHCTSTESGKAFDLKWKELKK